MARPDGMAGETNSFRLAPRVSQDSPRTQPGSFQGKASTFELPLLPLSLHLSAIAPFVTLFCVLLLSLAGLTCLGLCTTSTVLSNHCTVVMIQVNPRTVACDRLGHIACHGVRQGWPSCIGAVVCNRALQRPGSRAKRLRSTLWCVWPHRLLPIISLLCTKQVRFCVPLLAAATRSGLRTPFPFSFTFPFQRRFR